MKRLAILGAGGHGKVVADAAELCGWSVVFFDDAWPTLRSNGIWQVVGSSADFFQQIYCVDGVVVAIGDNRLRLARLDELRGLDIPLVSVVHPAAVVSRYAQIDFGVVVLAGAIVNMGARIGSGTILNSCCSVDHDCVLGKAVHISPGACLAGGVMVGDLSWIGIGASVRQMIRIGDRVMVGAGAAVVADVPEGATVVGVPANIIK